MSYQFYWGPIVSTIKQNMCFIPLFAEWRVNLDQKKITQAVLSDLSLRESVQIRSYFWSVFIPNSGKYRPEITPYLDTFHAVFLKLSIAFI